jgi:ABC-2 type transport system permease protein
MKKHLFLLYLRIKAAFRRIPGMLAMSVVFGVLIAAFGIAGTLLVYHTTERQPMSVALVIPENGREYSRMVFSFLYEIDTVNDYCSFQEMDEEAAFTRLESGDVEAIILLPDNFVESIMDGTNTPAQIILPKSGMTSSSPLFRELVNAGVCDLAVAQAGIYAIDDLCLKYGLRSSLASIELKINEIYMSYALNRDIYFDRQTVSATGSLTLTWFYIRSGVVLLLFLCSISCMGLLRGDNRGLSEALKVSGISTGYSQCCKALSVALVYFIPLSVACLAFGMYNLVLLFFILFIIFIMAETLLCLSGNMTTGVLVLFMAVMVMMFASGGIIPSAFLPNTMQAVGRWMPTTVILELAGDLIGKNVNIIHVIYGIVLCVGCVMIQVVCLKLKLRT